MMKLYRATVQVPVVVLAEDQDQAQHIALAAARKQILDPLDTNITVAEIQSEADLPAGWEPQHQPYTQTLDQTQIQVGTTVSNISYLLKKQGR